MQNLTMLLSKPTLVIEDENTRIGTYSYGTETEIRTSKNCCVCKESMWARQNSVSTWLLGAKVMDPRAYVGGLPDYLKNSSLLLEVHETCQSDLNQSLTDGLYIADPIV